MLLSEKSLDALTNILTGLNNLTEKQKKSFVDVIFKHHDIQPQTYEIIFAEEIDIKNNILFSNMDFKLFQYTKLMLQKVNGTSKIFEILDDEIQYIYNSYEQERCDEIFQYLNNKFLDDNYSIEIIETLNKPIIYTLDDTLVNYNCLFTETERGSFALINQHNKKCFEKIKTGDYSGAITNSRSLLEQILRELQKEFEHIDNTSRYNGKDIVRLYNDVIDRLNIKEGLVAQPLVGYTKLEQGFEKLIDGVSIIRHGMSDAHNISHEPSIKDAVLAVNTAKTIANFIVKIYFEKFVDAA